MTATLKVNLATKDYQQQPAMTSDGNSWGWWHWRIGNVQQLKTAATVMTWQLSDFRKNFDMMLKFFWWLLSADLPHFLLHNSCPTTHREELSHFIGRSVLHQQEQGKVEENIRPLDRRAGYFDKDLADWIMFTMKLPMILGACWLGYDVENEGRRSGEREGGGNLIIFINR